MIEAGFVERIRTAMQNHTVQHDFEWPTPEQRRAHIEREQRDYDAMLEKAKGRFYL